MSKLNIIDPELRIKFLMKLEMDGILNKGAMRVHLGLRRMTEVDKILNDLQAEDLVEMGSAEFESEGKFQLTVSGLRYLHPEYNDVQVGSEVVGEEQMMEDEVVRTFEEGAKLWVGILQIIEESGGSLHLNEDVEQGIIMKLGLTGPRDLEERLWELDGVCLRASTIENLDGKTLDITDKGKEILSGELSFKDPNAVEDTQEQEGNDDDDDSQIEEVDILQRLMRHVEGPGTLRLDTNSLGVAKNHLRLVSDDEFKTVLLEAQKLGLLENNDRGGLRITREGREYVESRRGSESAGKENDPWSGKLLAAE